MSRGGCELTLLLPGLAGPKDPGTGDPREAARLLVADLELPAFARLAGRAGTSGSSLHGTSAESLLFQAFGMDSTGDGDWPAGAVTREGAAGDAADGVWIRADPVHLRADMGKLILFAPHALALEPGEAKAIAAWLREHPHHPGPAVEPVGATDWVAPLEAVPAMHTVPPAEAHGRHVDESLPRGPDAAHWHRRLNEIQMLLHQCPVNEERARRGLLAGNSLWFWGAGVLPVPAPAPFRVALGAHGLLSGLVRHRDCVWEPAPGDLGSWLSSPPPGPALMLREDLMLPALASDLVGWQRAMVALEQEWLAPVLRALSRGRISRLTVHAGDGRGFQATRRDVGGWWRRTPPAGTALAALRGHPSS